MKYNEKHPLVSVCRKESAYRWDVSVEDGVLGQRSYRVTADFIFDLYLIKLTHMMGGYGA